MIKNKIKGSFRRSLKFIETSNLDNHYESHEVLFIGKFFIAEGSLPCIAIGGPLVLQVVRIFFEALINSKYYIVMTALFYD